MARDSDDTKQIQQRMYKEAAAIYEQYSGKKLSRLEGFDPLVYMLIGACASEFGKLSQEIQSSWARMLEYVAQLLTPEVYTGAVSAHAIVHARSSLGNINTRKDKDVAFFQNYEGQEVRFSPSGNFPLWSGDIQFMASNETFYSLDNVQDKRELKKTTFRQQLPPFTLWLGIDLLLEETGAPEELRFYFDWPSETLIDQSEEILLASSWSINGQGLKTKVGLQEYDADPLHNVHTEFNLARKVERQTNVFYQNRFISVFFDQAKGIMQRTILPPELKAVFNETLSKDIKNPLYWLKVEFSPAFFHNYQQASQIIDKTNCLINCFPVINRRLSEPSFTLNKNINLFPLAARKFFHCIEEVISSNVKHYYQEKPFVELFDEHAFTTGKDIRTYYLRKEGVNRFDQRDAVGVIENLLRYMREEAFIFSALGRDVIANNIKMIHRAINDIEGKILLKKKEEGLDQQQDQFIAFPPGIRENVIVRYWSTDGFSANNIPSGEHLSLYGQTPWERSSIVLITQTQGGRDPLGEMDRMHEFKSALVARDKIVTEEDIRLFCFNELGSEIVDIEIRQGVKVSSNRREGLIRTLDVVIRVKESFPDDPEHQLVIRRKLEVQLNTQSSSVVPIRTFLVWGQEKPAT